MANVAKIVHTIAIDVATYRHQRHVEVAAQITKDGNVVNNHQNQNDGMTHHGKHGHEDNPGVNLTSRHLGQRNVRRQNGHEQTIANDIGRLDIERTDAQMEKDGRQKSH